LREIEVKDMHISQLDTMLKRKDDELEHLRQTNNKILSTKSNTGIFSNESVFKTHNYIVNDENRKFNSSDEFQKNEENENQLKKLMNYNSERSETKQPGKIYSIRRK
jgi:hypothetical protein